MNHRNEIVEALYNSPFPLSAKSIFKTMKRNTIYANALDVNDICWAASVDTGFNPIIRHGENTNGDMLYGIKRGARP